MNRGKVLRGLALVMMLLCSCVFLGACSGLLEEEEITVVELSAPPGREPAASPASLDGDWYGYWEMFSTSGEWAELKRQKWACFAEIDKDGSMWLWDEDLDKEKGLADFETVRNGDTLSITGGSFLNVSSGFEDWRLVIKTDEQGSLLVLRGHYERNAGDKFSFVMYLRPWGSLWPENEDERPDNYEEFYLKLKDKPMPDSFE